MLANKVCDGARPVRKRLGLMLKPRVHGPRSVSLVALIRAARAHAPLLSLLGATTLVACAAATDDDDGEPPPPYGVLPNNPGAAGSGAAPVGAGFGGSSGVTPGVNSGQGGSAYVPPATGQGGSNGIPPAGAGGTGAVNSGAGGSAATGAGGTDAVTPPPTGSGGTGSDPNQPPPGDPPPPPVGGDIACPAGATFCSGFEGSDVPSGTQFHAGGPPSLTYELDDTEAFAGNQSLLIPATGAGFYYRALAVPVPGNDFWVRLHVRVSTVFGDNSHDSLFGGSSGALAADNNNENLVELSEQFGGVLLNTKDDVFPEGPAVTTGTVSANTWHCFEAHYNGNNGNVDVFMDGTQVIAAAAYKPLTYASFRIGYMRYNNDRAVWFDDVVVAPQRVNCP
jgi:hypothetical protein